MKLNPHVYGCMRGEMFFFCFHSSFSLQRKDIQMSCARVYCELITQVTRMLAPIPQHPKFYKHRQAMLRLYESLPSNPIKTNIWFLNSLWHGLNVLIIYSLTTIDVSDHFKMTQRKNCKPIEQYLGYFDVRIEDDVKCGGSMTNTGTRENLWLVRGICTVGIDY